jgi:hypothetical protein
VNEQVIRMEVAKLELKPNDILFLRVGSSDIAFVPSKEYGDQLLKLATDIIENLGLSGKIGVMLVPYFVAPVVIREAPEPDLEPAKTEPPAPVDRGLPVKLFIHVPPGYIRGMTFRTVDYVDAIDVHANDLCALALSKFLDARKVDIDLSAFWTLRTRTGRTLKDASRVIDECCSGDHLWLAQAPRL